MPKTILFVDDEVLILSAIRRALGHRGVHVLIASSGEEAMRQLVKGPVDVIVVDINLSGECGADVAADLLRIAPNAKIVFMSAHSKETLAEDGLFLGDARFVRKPVALDSLERTLSLLPPPCAQ